MQNKRCLKVKPNHFVASEIPKHKAIDLIHKKFENLNSISNIFQETHDFLVLMESVIICIYLRNSQRKFLSKKTTDRHFRKQSNVRHPISKLLKCDLVQNLNIFRGHSLQFLVDKSLGEFYFILLFYCYCSYQMLQERRFCLIKGHDLTINKKTLCIVTIATICSNLA